MARTAVLGGHVARCKDCAYVIAYNSCPTGTALSVTNISEPRGSLRLSPHLAKCVLCCDLVATLPGRRGGPPIGPKVVPQLEFSDLPRDCSRRSKSAASSAIVHQWRAISVKARRILSSFSSAARRSHSAASCRQRSTREVMQAVPLPLQQLKADGLGPTEIARTLKIGRASVYRAFGERRPLTTAGEDVQRLGKPCSRTAHSRTSHPCGRHPSCRSNSRCAIAMS
jgi:hypothetical protein